MAVSPYLDRYELDEDAVIYRSSFDEPGALDLPGWNVDQGTAVLVEEGRQGACVKVEPSPEGKFGQVTFKLDPPPNLPVLFVDFYVKPVAFDEGPEEFADVAGSVTGAFRLVKDEETDQNTAALYVLNGNGERGGDWIDTGVTFTLDDEGRPTHWMRLTFRQEFQRDDTEASQSRWDLWVDGLLVSGNLGYFDRETVDPGRISLLGHREVPLFLDDLLVSSENPLFADQNRDGLSDAYVSAYKLDGRDADEDADGLTNFQEFILRTNPALADSDGDGLADGEEVQTKRNPLSAEDALEVANIVGATGVASDQTYCTDMFLSYYITPATHGPEIKVNSVQVFDQDGVMIIGSAGNNFQGWRLHPGYITAISWAGDISRGTVHTTWQTRDWYYENGNQVYTDPTEPETTVTEFCCSCCGDTGST